MKHKRLIVGLTGGIGSGKSEALKAFAGLGAGTLCLDELAHQVLRRGGEAFGPVLRAFGPALLGRDGEFDRKALASVVFVDPRLRRRLERLTHPAILAAMRRRVRRQRRGVLVIDAPLLFEAGLEGEFDLTVVVTAGLGERLRRVRRRGGMTASQTRRRLAAQLPQADKARRADAAIANDGTLRELRRKVREYYRAFELMHGG